MAVDPRAPCIIGAARRTWHPDEVADGGAPEPLAMWEDVARGAAADAGAPRALTALDSIQVVWCETWQYDDPPGRLAQRLGASPRHRHYSGIGGTTPQQLLGSTGESMLRGELDLALVTSGEALATKRAFKKRGERYPYTFAPERRRPYPWEAPMHPAEVAHEVFQAWLTFAMFDNARRARLGTPLAAYREAIGRLLAPLTEVAAGNPHAWFRIARTPDDIVRVRPDNRMVGYPYTKYAVAIMDVDMAAALLVATHERADALGVPPDRRVYLRGWSYATDPVYVAEHDDLSRSPALGAAAREALAVAGATVDDVAHLDLYSCFASSLHFARDALDLAADDARPLTVTGGLPYHGGPGSGYLTHSIATMADVLRAEPGSLGLVSGVGMHMTKHAFGVYSTDPGVLRPPSDVQAAVDALAPPRAIVEEHDGDATVAAYSVVHDRAGDPSWGVTVCDLADGSRAYGRITDRDLLLRAESEELVGARVRLAPEAVEGPAGPARVNTVRA